MRQTLLTNISSSTQKLPVDSQLESLLGVVQSESDVLFYMVIPNGIMLRQLSDVLQKYTRTCLLVVQPDQLQFLADESRGKTHRTLSAHISSHDSHRYYVACKNTLKFNLDTTPLYAISSQLKKKDQVLVYITSENVLGIAVNYTRECSHVKHAMICLSVVTCERTGHCKQTAPTDRTAGISIDAPVLQRILREMRTLTRFVVFNGNASYLQICSDDRYSEHRSDNVFGVPNGEVCTLNVDVCVATVSMILKTVQFSSCVRVFCEEGNRLRLEAGFKKAKASYMEVLVYNTLVDPEKNNVDCMRVMSENKRRCYRNGE